MKTTRSSLVAAMLAVVAVCSTGCGRSDTRVNSDPGPGKPTRADTGDKTLPPATSATSASTATSPTTGTDSTGRPGDASGGVTGGVAGSQTSGTTTEKPKADNAK